MRHLSRAGDQRGGASDDATRDIETRAAVPGWRTRRKARLKRIGVIDVGSNSVRLVVFDGMARSPAYFYNEKVLCGLGAGPERDRAAQPRGLEQALAALHRFAALAGRMELSGMIAVATAAVREAADGPAFCDQVERETGLQLHVASGSEEARLAAKGVLLGWPDADGLVCDMGGASMELAQLDRGRDPRLRHLAARAAAARRHRRRRQARQGDQEGRQGAAQGGARRGAAALPGRRLVAGDRAARHGAGRLSR